MTLQALILELASRSTRPDPSQAIWITSCPDPIGEQYAEALAQATVKLEDDFNIHPVQKSKHIYLGGTAEAWDSVSQLKITCWADYLVKLGWGFNIFEQDLIDLAGVCDGAQQLTKRVDILLDAHPHEMVAIYAPYNHLPTLHGILRLKAHYVSDDKSWRCSISAIDSVRKAFPSPEYHHSEEFLRQFEPIDCGF